MAISAGTSEYDRFGPWIDEVRVEDDVPRLYRDHPIDLGAARLVLKVPRNITRRDATPDMDLYDHLLVLGAGQLTVLSRRVAPRERRGPVPSGYDARTVAIDEVVAIRDVVSMLDGRLTILTRDGQELSLGYNGSGRRSIAQLVDALRGDVRPAQSGGYGWSGGYGDALATAAAEQAGERSPLALDREDMSLVGDYASIAGRLPGLVPWAWHGRRLVAPRGAGASGAARRALHVLSPMTLHGAVVAGDDVALEVFGRHGWLVRGKAPVHSASRLLVPFGALDAVQIDPHDGYHGAVEATLVLGDARVSLVLPEDSAAHGLFERGSALMA